MEQCLNTSIARTAIWPTPSAAVVEGESAQGPCGGLVAISKTQYVADRNIEILILIVLLGAYM